MSTDYFQYGALASPERTPENTPPDLPALTPSSRGRKHRDFSAKSAPLPSFAQPPSRDGSAHAFDPNRFTPTLHASLVSEILSLRRELDSKHHFIENLEESLKTANTENENLSGQIRDSAKKTRQLEQKFTLLENGTFDAVEGLLGERDNVKVANQELRNRLDLVSKKAKALEQETARARESWDQERNKWDNERRQLEQKVHVSETRLRKVVEELRVQQLATQEAQQKSDEVSGESDFSGIRNYRTSKHARNQSSMSIRSLAPSIGSIRRPGMTSLANELNSDDDEYDTEELKDDDDVGLSLFAENRSSINSRASAISDRKAKKILGLEITPEGPTEADGVRAPSIESLRTPSFAERFGLQMAKMNFRASEATRTSSRSTSPARQRAESAYEASSNLTGDQNTGAEAAMVPTQLKPAAQGPQSKLTNLLTSGRSIETPLSPPDTPLNTIHEYARTVHLTKPMYQSASTQTDLVTAGELAARRNTTMTPIEVLPIPAITIQPPMSPRTGDGVLPRGMRSSSVQTDCAVTKPMLDVGVQTEEIRVDKRPIKLPPHLLPSALEYSKDKEKDNKAAFEVPTTKKNKSTMHRSTFSKDGNRLRLKPINLPPPRLRSISRDHQNSEVETLRETSPQWSTEVDMNDRPAESSDDMRAVFGNMPGIVRPSVRSLFSDPPKTVPENRAVSPANFGKSSTQPSSFRHGMGMGSDGSSNQSRPSSSRGTSHSVRTGPFFSSYERNHGRPESASSQAPPPPFPIPGRMSSRPPSNDGTRSPTGRDAYSMRSRRSSKDSRIAPDGGLRKVQSSGAMRANARMSPRRRRRAPDLEPIQSMAFDTPSKDNLLLPGIVTPTGDQSGIPIEAQYVDSPDFDQDSAVEEEEEKSQDNIIVDAIAATMVGEWMWKYVRRRRSFGLGESRGDQVDDGTTSGVRHKRWVWLSPYEHTVMWSSKQPNSGPALLGKAGRKLVIKSVLDVKDTTPLHKSASHESLFDRSILILTPERALKLTASNRERHYLWLTALSFLAESGRGPPQIPRMSPSEPVLENDQRRRSSLMPGPVLPARTAYGPAPPSTRAEAPQRLGTADSTAPPNIKRYGGGRHQRKRSSTNPQFSAAMPINEGSAMFARRASNTVTVRPPVDYSARPSLRDRKSSNGTVRMDAFIGRVGDHTSQHDSRRDDRRRGDSSAQYKMKGDMFGESEIDPFEEF